VFYCSFASFLLQPCRCQSFAGAFSVDVLEDVAMENEILDHFRRLDQNGHGLIERSVLAKILQQVMFLSLPDIWTILDAAAVTENGNVRYEELVHWIMNTGQKRSPAVSASRELDEIAYDLANIASQVADKDQAVSSALISHAASLRQIRKSWFSNDLEMRPSVTGQSADVSRKIVAENNALLKLTQHHLVPHVLTDEQIGFREQAAQVVQKTGSPGESIDDIEVVAIADVQDKLAISYWRFCEGLRVYRSRTATQALRLICSAPVPGLGATTYLDVFDSLSSAAWTNHVYLFGGLVRDILRRTVGNDIDIGFSAPARELKEICQTKGYTCQLDGDYILVGDENGEEYLEGMVISFNGIQPSYHADFSMNTLFYDFTNDIIIDKTGCAVPAVIANRCDIPCPRHRWKCWLNINGVRVLFRYYKFLLRGYNAVDEECIYVTEQLLDFWALDATHTIEVGRIALGNLVSSEDAGKIGKLQELVFRSFDMISKQYTTSRAHVKASVPDLGLPQTKKKNRSATLPDMLPDDAKTQRQNSTFFSASSWWRKGWLVLLKLPP